MAPVSSNLERGYAEKMLSLTAGCGVIGPAMPVLGVWTEETLAQMVWLATWSVTMNTYLWHVWFVSIGRGRTGLFGGGVERRCL